ncbi:MAG: PEP-utilizing protein mobile subunit [Gammaproteobacteria bacterium]|nr:PEP-utilizing protein mobile subunit [Gammaproteobacteria bacterium]
MSDVAPLDDYVTDEWYPGFKPNFEQAAWAIEPFRTFNKEDESRFWFLDFHWPRGMTPLGLIWCEDGYTWGSQLAAETLPLPPGYGVACRIAGTHIYGNGIDVHSAHEIAQRGARMARNLPPILQRFPELWAERAEELKSALHYFENFDYRQRSLAGLWQPLFEARRFFKRSFEIHFELMYPLLVNYIGFRGLCQELGIDPAEIGKFCQGYDNKILETDRELWKVTAEARRLGISDIFAANEPENLKTALQAAGGNAQRWLDRFDEFLGVYGYRTEGACDVYLPAWIEDPTPPLGTIRTFLQKSRDFDFAAARRGAIDERDTAVEVARSKLSRAELEAFNAGLDSVRHANFAWWNDEHNFLIDLRSTLPLRRAALAIGEAAGAERKDDTCFLFWPELRDLCAGKRTWHSFRGIVKDRRDYYAYWNARRPQMPKVLGTIPAHVSDPVLIEIFGLHHHFFEGIRNAGKQVDTLVGVAASSGLVRGRARVLFTADQLHRIEPGEILICESTSPNWTPCFGKIAACVCDGGGTLAHASIVSREYRIPCVVGVGTATLMIKTGDTVEVDGGKGIVRVIR